MKTLRVMKHVRSTITSILFVAAACGSEAAPVSFNEALSGDIQAGQVFSLDYGLNTISGTKISGANFVDGTYVGFGDLDDFVVTLPAGAAIMNANIKVEVHDTPGNAAGYQLELWWNRENGAIVGYNCFGLKAPNSCDHTTPEAEFAFFSGTALRDGPFALSLGFAAFPEVHGLAYGGELAYTISLAVAVPEPSTVLLMGLGVALLLGAARLRTTTMQRSTPFQTA
jgi:hypothetical protein